MITDRQESPKQLLKLAAQRQLYADAKAIFGWHVLLSGPIALTTAIVALLVPSSKVYVAAWGLLVALADLLWLVHWQKRLRDKASRIQESFDCDVLELEWNSLKAGRVPEPELIKKHADRYERWAATMPPLSGWYSPRVGSLPLHVGRIACQRSNCWWDSAQRRTYANWTIAAVVIVFFGLLSIGLLKGVSMADLVLKVLVPFAPALVLGVRQYFDQLDSAVRGERLVEHADALWRDALAGERPELLRGRSRNLQDEILENRRRSPLVWDWLFRKIRPEFETQMNFGVDDLVAQATSKGATLVRDSDA